MKYMLYRTPDAFVSKGQALFMLTFNRATHNGFMDYCMSFYFEKRGYLYGPRMERMFGIYNIIGSCKPGMYKFATVSIRTEHIEYIAEMKRRTDLSLISEAEFETYRDIADLPHYGATVLDKKQQIWNYPT